MEGRVLTFEYKKLLDDGIILSKQHNGIAAYCEGKEYRLLLLLHTNQEPKYLIQRRNNDYWVNLMCLDEFNDIKFSPNDLENLVLIMSENLKSVYYSLA